MTARIGRAIAGAAAMAAAIATGCGRPSTEATTGDTPPPVATAPRPVDHLSAGELLEGPALAFGMHLPRGVDVEGAFSDEVIASGPVGLHPFVEYLKARLRDGDVREGETSATFDHVRVAGNAASPELRVHLGISIEGVRVDIHDETPTGVTPPADETARWRRAGLTPDGHLADPHHLD
jgi:hypothetical protein